MNDAEIRTPPRYDAVLFDLLTALLDSWSLWNTVAGDRHLGVRWRTTYLELTYGAGEYRPYEDVVKEAAARVGLPHDTPTELIRRWDQLQAWPEAPMVVRTLARYVPVAAVTNCSESLAQQAVRRTGGTFAVIVSAERAGHYKPRPQPYRLALSELRVSPERALFVAGSAFDLPGASEVGMPVFWHNRMGLPLPEVQQPPVAMEKSLQPLVPLVIGRSSEGPDVEDGLRF